MALVRFCIGQPQEGLFKQNSNRIVQDIDFFNELTFKSK